MKKILLILSVLICLSGYSQITNTIPLPKGGSITIPRSTFDNTSLYILNTLTPDTLTSDLSFVYSDFRTPVAGTNFTLWFNFTTINPNGHKVFVLSNDLTTLVSGSVNLQLFCQYDGIQWTVFSVDQTIDQALSSYVSLPQLVDTLGNYVRQSQLVNTVDTLAGLNSAAFNRISVPLQATSDSSLSAANTATVKRILQSYARLASPVFTGVPISTTPSNGDNSSKIATTNFVQNALSLYQPSIILSNATISPTVVLGAGAGTGATATVTGNAVGFQINLTTGTGCTDTAAICTVNFTLPYPNTPLAFIQPRNINATSAAAYLIRPSESTTGITLVSGLSALASNTQYIFNVVVIGQ